METSKDKNEESRGREKQERDLAEISLWLRVVDAGRPSEDSRLSIGPFPQRFPITSTFVPDPSDK
jgi:hypothetical protein